MTILDFNQKKENQEKKKTIIFEELVHFYKDLDEANGGVNTPYFLQARNKYKEIIKNNKDVNFFYKEIMKHRNIL